MFVRVYGLRLGRSRIFAAPTTHSCFVAGELGGGGICAVVGGCAADGCGEVQSREGQAEARVQAAGGCGGMHPIDTHTRWSKRPHLQQVRFSAYKTLFEDTKAYQPIKSQSPRVSHDEQYLSHFASLQILLACSIENLLDNPSSIPGRAQKVF